MTVQMQVRPLGPWPGGERTKLRRPANFKRNLGLDDANRIGGGKERIPLIDTLDLLQRELDWIGCREAVIEAGYRADHIKSDGWPSARATAPTDPGVVLRVVNSRVGALTYPCDTFTRHEDNLRAVALTLRAQRMIDRYGVTKRGEQYTGWKALPAQGTTTLTADAAMALLVAYADPDLSSDVARTAATMALKHQDAARGYFTRARVRTHPDKPGGSTERFQQVGTAWGVLVAHFSHDNGGR